ncbi:choice-of-anchor J domain-containing protein, partial [bacterium]|nr:choice-of-anchor J domain-containing protein [bacterium]
AFPIEPEWLPPTAQLGYLIVAADAFEDTARIIADWKSRKGYSVKLRTVGDLGGTAGSIRNWIVSEYDSAAVPPMFVLLVGDNDDVPSFEGDSSSSETDTPYGDLDGSGFIPELFVGRISPEDASQLAGFMRRIVSYERFDLPAGHRDFAHKAAFLASDDASNWDLAEETQRYVIGEHFAPAGFDCDSIWAHSDPLAGEHSIAAVEDGRSILSYTGHGGYYSWSGPSVEADDVRALFNADEYPFVISNACITGTFHLAECFGETWIRQENAGAIGFIGASNNSYWDEDDIMERVMFDDVFRADYRFAGGMLNRGLMGVYVAYPASAEYYFDEYNLLGDPSLAIWFGDPTELLAVYPSMLSVGGAVSVSVTSGGVAVDSAMVCATNGSAVHSVGYTDLSGNVTLSVAGAGIGDTIYITASAYDMVPHAGFAIVGDGGPWLAMDSISIDDSAGDDDGVADIGETVALTVWLKNIGAEDAVSVVGWLRTDEVAATIVDSTSGFGTIVEAGSGSNATPFSVDLNNDIEDGEVLNFTIHTEDIVDSSWEVPLGLAIAAPALSIVSHTMSDSLGGDGDGFLEPGESARFTVDVLNDGGETARFLSLSLALEPNPYVSVTAASSGIDSIVPGRTRTNSPAFELSADTSCPTPYMVEAFVTARDYRGSSCTDTIVVTVGTAGFVEDCESGIGGWLSDGIWHLSEHRFASPGHCWYSGVEDNFMYRDSTDAVLISPESATPDDAMLTFWHYFNTEDYYDICYVYYTTDGGGSWYEVGQFTGPAGRWQFARFDLSSVLSPGTPVRFKFVMSADVYAGGEGWYIDDIEFASSQRAYLGAGGVEPFAGDGSTDFRFVTTCCASSGSVPSSAKVIVDGAEHNLSLAGGSLTTGALFEYHTTLVPDEYSYHYEFVFGTDTVRFPKSGEIDGPFVSTALYSFDVGSNDAGISHYGPLDDWEYGVPSSGPSSVPVGTNCWATNLDGDYSDSSRSRLVLPAMDLSGLEKAYLCFYHWYRFQSSESFSFHDGGNIKISVDGGLDTFLVHPQLGYDGNASQYNHFVAW